MKKIFTLFAAVALTASAAMADVITLDLSKPMNPTSLEYNEQGIWTGCYNDVDYTWMEFGDENGEFLLSHLIGGEGSSWGGMYWDGFCPAQGGDITDYGVAGSGGSWTTNYGGCMAGGGCVINDDGSVSADASQPYLVAYYGSWSQNPTNQVMFVDKDGHTTFKPAGVYVCNHPWPYYETLNGDASASAFDEGDYFELTAHGVDAQGNETTTSINLVEYTNGELKALNDWTYFDLSSLGEVESVYFTLNSTDVGTYGMNTGIHDYRDMYAVGLGKYNTLYETIAYDADAGRAPGIGSAASRDSYDAISCVDTAPIPLGAIEGSLGHEPEATADTTPETISTTPVEPELCASYEVHDPFTMALPSFFIKLTPSHEETGAVTWSCGVELASA